MPIFCHRRWIGIFCHLFSTHQRSKKFFSDAWQAPAIYHRPTCELCDLGWVGAPNERAPLRVHDAIAIFAARCLTRTRIANQGLGGVHEHWIPRELSRRVKNLPACLSAATSINTSVFFVVKHETKAVTVSSWISYRKIRSIKTSNFRCIV